MKHAWFVIAATLLPVACSAGGDRDVSVRFATFNTALSRDEAGGLSRALSTPDDAQARAVAEIIQRVDPDVLLINEFDYDRSGRTAALFVENYLAIGQNGAAPIAYPYVFTAQPNTGVPTGSDLDHDGAIGMMPGTIAYANDCAGFGRYPGQYGMLLLSKHRFVTEDVRTFRGFAWNDMPDARMPEGWYDETDRLVLPLSSKSHWDVPIDVDGTIIHVLACHPTPPVFDGPEDRNGARNHDEIRFWADYVDPARSAYIYDDARQPGGLAAGAHFVIMGDLNADPSDGESVAGAASRLLDSPLVNTSIAPASPGGAEQAAAQGGVNEKHRGDPALDTCDFADTSAGNLRVDYVLPSAGLRLRAAGVFWPRQDDPLFRLVGTYPFPASDHRLVWADVRDPQ